MKQSYKDYLALTNQVSVNCLEDAQLSAYMWKEHPRFYELVEKFGNPLEMVSAQKEGTNINNSSAKVSLVSECQATLGKVLSKKLLTSMTVAMLKSLCSKLFKTEALSIQLVYIEEGFEGEFLFDEEQRQLSFFSVRDGGKIVAREV